MPIGLSIVSSRKALPTTWYPEFQKLIGYKNRVKIKTKPSLDVVYKDLINSKLADVDLVTLGDAWLSSAIQSGCITPFKDAMDFRWDVMFSCEICNCFGFEGGSASCQIDGYDTSVAIRKAC